MAQLSKAQRRAAKQPRAIGLVLKPNIPALRIAAIFLFIFVSLVLPIYCFGQLLPELQPYLPQHIQTWLLLTPQAMKNTQEDTGLRSEAVLKACPTHQYTSSIISVSPLVIYIDDFTSSQEAEELINIGSPDFVSSYISRSRGANTLAAGRTSTSAPLPFEHPLVSCILNRARKFMGSMLLPHEPFSVPQLVRYSPQQKYDLHTDYWQEHQVMNDGSGRLFNRAASFFVFLRDNCTEGHTYFPRVEPSGTSAANQASNEQLEKWYGEKVTRGERDGEAMGVKFKPIKGNAIFWINLNEDGKGDKRVMHAGLPVGEGEKIGLNLWPRKFYGTENEDTVEKKERKGWSGKWKE